MKVQELIEMLRGYPKDAEVIMQADGEGNSYSPLHGMWLGSYRASSTWSGEVGLLGISEEDKERGYTAEDVMDGSDTALILVPVN